MTNKTTESTISFYTENVDNFNMKISTIEKKQNYFAAVRFLIILIGAFFMIFSFKRGNYFICEGIFALMVIGFVYIIKYQNNLDILKLKLQNLVKINENECDVYLKRENFYQNGSCFIDDNHFYTSDLDIFGEKSLFNLINRCSTIEGNDLLSTWLKSRNKNDEILKRQMASKEISKNIEWVQNFQESLLFSNLSTEYYSDTAKNYLNSEKFIVKKALQTYVKFIPFILFPLLIVCLFFSEMRFMITPFMIINLVIVGLNYNKISKVERELLLFEKNLKHYIRIFEILNMSKFESDKCLELFRRTMGEQKNHFSQILHSFSKLTYKFYIRRNRILGPVLNFLMLWDIRQLLNIEEFKNHKLQKLPEAFKAISEYEALISLSLLHFNNHTWIFPEFSKKENFVAVLSDIVHPLIPFVQAVSNSYLMDDKKVDIITGSNMSGKSTFLRTFAINSILAFAGASIPARNAVFGDFEIFSYMRIKDSLHENVSTFKSEINRIKMLFEAIKKKGKIFFVIDEMLRGTNSNDKFFGSKAIIENLIELKAFGMVATHDLNIPKMLKIYPNYIRNFYFDIKIFNNELYFDYKLQKGECVTTNATFLLKEIGVKFN